MKKSLALGLLTLIASWSIALGQTLPATKPQEIQTGEGAFTIPEGFTHIRTGTKDSYKGVLKRTADGFTIDLDLGFSAGAHTSQEMQAACAYFRAHTIGGCTALTGIQTKDGIKTITTCITDLTRKPVVVANFWATIRTDSDLADFLVIVSSFTPAKQKP